MVTKPEKRRRYPELRKQRPSDEQLAEIGREIRATYGPNLWWDRLRVSRPLLRSYTREEMLDRAEHFVGDATDDDTMPFNFREELERIKQRKARETAKTSS